MILKEIALVSYDGFIPMHVSFRVTYSTYADSGDIASIFHVEFDQLFKRYEMTSVTPDEVRRFLDDQNFREIDKNRFEEFVNNLPPPPQS